MFRALLRNLPALVADLLALLALGLVLYDPGLWPPAALLLVPAAALWLLYPYRRG
jgi:hypothetical protein